MDFDKSIQFQVISGIHIDKYYPYVPDFNNFINPSSDNLILAGDIGKIEYTDQYYKFIQSLSKHFKNVYLIPGSYEYFSETIDYSCLKNILIGFEKSIPNLTVLIDKWIDIEDSNIRLYGTTFWEYIPSLYDCEPVYIRENGFFSYHLINKEHFSSVYSLKHVINMTETENETLQKNIKLVVVSYFPILSVRNSSTFTNHIGIENCNDEDQGYLQHYRVKQYTEFYSTCINTMIFGFTHINRDFKIHFPRPRNPIRVVTNHFLTGEENVYDKNKTIRVFLSNFHIDIFKIKNKPNINFLSEYISQKELKYDFHPLKI